jgi:hypothetical protein
LRLWLVSPPPSLIFTLHNLCCFIFKCTHSPFAISDLQLSSANKVLLFSHSI